jgi:hypothetical protein
VRKVKGVIKTVQGALYAGKPLTFTLCDRYGNKKNKIERTSDAVVTGCQRGKEYDTKIAKTVREIQQTDTQGYFEVELGVTECDNLGDYYLLEFESSSELLPLKLYVRDGEGEIDFERCLVPFVKDRALSELMCDGKIDPNAKEVFKKYFNGEKLHNANEQRLINNYINYADGYNDKMAKIDEGVMDGM